MPKVHHNATVPPNQIRNRAEIAEEKATKKQENLEKKKGVYSSLKTKFADFKTMITGVESKRAVEKRLASTQASAPMTKAQIEAVFKNIHEQCTANIPAREKAHSASSKPVSSGSSGTPPIDPRLKNPLLFFDTPPPYSLHDPLTAINDSAEEMEALLDALDGLPNQAPDKPATTFKNKKSENFDNFLDEIEEMLADSPPSYSVHDPIKGPPPPSDDTGPLPPSYIPKPPTAEQIHDPAKKTNEAQSGVNKKQTVKLTKNELKEAIAMRKTVADGIYSLHKTEKNNLDFNRENTEKFLSFLDKCLGLKEGKVSLSEAGLMMVMSGSLTPYMNDTDFDKLTLIVDNAMVKSAGS